MPGLSEANTAGSMACAVTDAFKMDGNTGASEVSPLSAAGLLPMLWRSAKLLALPLAKTTVSLAAALTGTASSTVSLKAGVPRLRVRVSVLPEAVIA